MKETPKRYVVSAYDDDDVSDLIEEIVSYLDEVSLCPGQKCRVTIEVMDDDECFNDVDNDDYDDDLEDDYS